MGPGFFPLDEELAVLPGNLTPWLAEATVRLGTLIPSFAKAAAELTFFTGVVLHPDTVRARTEAAGAWVVAHEAATVTQVLQTYPDASATPDTLILSVDGAMVPLVGGEWAEVRTLVVGEVVAARADAPDSAIQTINCSYFSRLTKSAQFLEVAWGELHRRGIERARRVGAVVDGAPWCQSFLDLHASDAVRILDFPHAAEHLTSIAQTPSGDGILLTPEQLIHVRHALKTEGPAAILPLLRARVATQPTNHRLATELAYLEARVEQMQYPAFIAAGWPIGSGMVESANKLVVEDRLKGAGMHWAIPNLNPMLALRNAVCNDRWDATWQTITAMQRQHATQQRQTRHRRRATAKLGTSPIPSIPEASLPESPPTVPQELAPQPDAKPPHPWKRPFSIRRQCELANAA